MIGKKLMKYTPVLALSMFAASAHAVTVVNEDFEGDLSDWIVTTNNGTISLVADNGPSAGGSQAVSVKADTVASGGAASFPFLKIERVGGPLAGGAAVTVSYDAYAPTQTIDAPNPDVGKVVFIAELFSEFTGPGATNEILQGAPNFLNDTWTTYVFNTTLGPDASGGLSLGFKADCGATANCILDARIDNVRVEVEAVPVPAAVWLFGSGLLGLVGVARRKKASA